MPNTSTLTHPEASPRRTKKSATVAPVVSETKVAGPETKRPAADSLGGLNGLIKASLGEISPYEDIPTDIPLDLIVPDANNPESRIDPTAHDIIELSESIKSVGQLTPLMVRRLSGRRFQIIFGHRRFTALQLADFKTAKCVIRDCTVEEAAILQVIENDQREDLSPVDQARSYETAMRLGELSQGAFAKKIGRSQAYISHRIRLLSLPEQVQDWIRQGVMTGTQGRELAVLAGVPACTKAFVDSVTLNNGKPLDEEEFLYAMNEAVDEGLRPMAAGYNGPKFKPTEEQLSRLQIIEVNRYGSIEKFASNVKLWEELQAEAEKAIAAKQAGGSKSSSKTTKDGKPAVKTLTAAQLKAQAEQAAAVLNKRVYRYYIAWLQDRLLERAGNLTSTDVLRFALAMATHHGNSWDRRTGFLEGVAAFRKGKAPTSGIGEMWEFCRKLSDQEIEGCVRQWFLVFLRAPAKSGATNGCPVGIESFAKMLDVDVSQWKCDRAFLDLHTMDQLRALEKEWALSPSTQTSKSGLVDEILKGSVGKPAPKSLTGVKPVHLD